VRTVVATLLLLWAAAVIAFYFRIVPAMLTGGAEGLGEIVEGYGGLSLPMFSEAAQRAAIAIVAGLMVTTAAIVTGTLITRLLRWTSPHPGEQIATSAAVGIGTYSLLGFVLGIAGLYKPVLLQALTVVPAVGWFVQMAWRNSPGGVLPKKRFRLRRIDWLWLSLVALVLVFVLANTVVPERDYEALWYHLQFPRLALASGHLVDVPTEFVSLRPMAWEMWFGYGLALGGPGVAGMLHFLTLPLTLCMVHGLARRVVPNVSPWLPVAIVAAIPLVQWNAATANVDLACAFHVTVMLAALTDYLESERRASLVIGALNCGFALATSHLAVFAAAIVLPWLVFGMLARRRGVPGAAVAAGTLAGIAILPPALWYVRAWMLSGDPFSPHLFQLLGARDGRWSWDAETQRSEFYGRFGRPRTPLHVLTLPWDLTMHALRYAGTIGPLFLAFVPAALLRPRSIRPESRRCLLELLAFAAAAVAVWALTSRSQEVRGLLPVLPTLAILAAAGIGAIGSNGGMLLRVPVRIAVSIVMLLSLPVLMRLHEPERDGYANWLPSTLHQLPMAAFGSETGATYVARGVPTAAACAWASANLRSDARMLAFSSGDNFLCPPHRIDAFSPQLSFIWNETTSPDSVVAALDDMGITYVLRDRGFLRESGFDSNETWETFPLTRDSTLFRFWDRVYNDRRVDIFRRLDGERQLPPDTTAGLP
jgi:hypothetical protein